MWQYFDPDLGTFVEHLGLVEDFPREVNRLREVNSLEPLPETHLFHLIMTYICDTAPPGTCVGQEPTRNRPVLTITKVANFTRTLVAITRAKVDGEDIYNKDPDAAAKVCMTCPLNRRELCATCTGLESVARKLLRANQTTSYDRVLGACEACGCMLRVKVHFSPEVLRRTISKKDRKKYPDHCWIFKDAPE